MQAGERRELRRLVQHGVAGDERRHEHVAADEVRIVPRRDVGDDAERLVGDPLLELLRRIGEHLLLAQRARRFGEEEIDAGERGRSSSLRDWRIGLPTSCVSVVRQRFRARATTRSRNLSIACDAPGASALPPIAGCAARAAAYFARDRPAAPSAATTRTSGAPVAGLVIFSVVAAITGLAFRARTASRNSFRIGVAVEMLDADARPNMELGMPLARRTRSSARASGIASTMPSGTASASTTMPAAELVHRLMVNRVDRRVGAIRDRVCASRVPDTNRQRVEVALVVRDVAMIERARHLRRRCPDTACRRTRR